VSFDHLEALTIHRCPNITDAGIDTLTKTTKQLKSLSLIYCAASGEGITANLDALENVELTECQNLTDEGLHNILKAAKGLTALKFSTSKVTEAGMNSVLQNTTQLKVLDVGSSVITGSGIPGNLDKMEQITLWSCFQIAEKELERLKEAYPNAQIQH